MATDTDGILVIFMIPKKRSSTYVYWKILKKLLIHFNKAFLADTKDIIVEFFTAWHKCKDAQENIGKWHFPIRNSKQKKTIKAHKEKGGTQVVG